MRTIIALVIIVSSIWGGFYFGYKFYHGQNEPVSWQFFPTIMSSIISILIGAAIGLSGGNSSDETKEKQI